MAELTSYFNDFLKDIRLTGNQISDCKKGHETLRKRLREEEYLKDIIVSDFIQGSYKRATAVRPLGEDRSDVDVIVVTNLDKDEVEPDAALEKFRPFLEKWYGGKYKKQGRSWGIELSYVELDLVPTAAPSEVAEKMVRSESILKNFSLEEMGFKSIREDLLFASKSALNLSFSEKSSEWRSDPLWIPDRNAKEWQKTDPLTQIALTQEKNKSCNGHFVNVVKCLKWWRKAMQPEPKYPKSYPLEHLIYLNCPSGINSVAQGVVFSLEAIRDNYKSYADQETTPFIPDHGLKEQNVFSRVSGEDFAKFHELVCDAAEIAREAYDEKNVTKSINLWKELFGQKFPDPPKDGKNSTNSDSGGFSSRNGISNISSGRFA